MSRQAILKAANRYARALLVLSDEKKLSERCFDDMSLLDAVFRQSKEIRVLLRSPVVREHHKQRVIKALLTPYFHPLHLQYLLIVIRKKRAELLEGIAPAYMRIYRETMGIVEVHITTAHPMDKNLENKAREVALRLTPLHVDFHRHIDSSLIGGFVLRLGDQMIDSSLKGRLDRVRKHLNV